MTDPRLDVLPTVLPALNPNIVVVAPLDETTILYTIELYDLLTITITNHKVSLEVFF